IADLSERILFIIVVFRERIEACAAWKSLVSEVNNYPCRVNVLVYDNSPEPQKPEPGDRMLLHYHHNAGNAGVSEAYNFGKKIADESGKNWLLLLDQDTQISPGSLEKYAETLGKNPGALILAPLVMDQEGILSPFIFKGSSGRRIRSVLPELLSLKTYSAINSGLLIQSVAFQEAGGYDPSFPLDFSDIAFLKKFQVVSDHLFIVRTELHQHFSGSTKAGLQDALSRFSTYSQATRSMGTLTGNKTGFWIRSLSRAIHLGIRYR